METALAESLHYAEEQMRPSSIQTIADIYGYIVAGLNRNAVNNLGDEILAMKFVSVTMSDNFNVGSRRHLLLRVRF